MRIQTALLATMAMAGFAAAETQTLSAFLPGSPLHGQAVAAFGQAFYFGIPTSSFCPDNVPLSQCPAPNNETVFYPGLINLNVRDTSFYLARY